MLTRRGKGRRAGTLRKHVKVWQRYTRWLLASCSSRWPETPVDFADYLLSRAMEPCGQSIPVSVYKTLIFMEHAAEVPKVISGSDAVKNALEEIKLQLEASELRPRKQAVQLLVTIVAAMERKVTQADARTCMWRNPIGRRQVGGFGRNLRTSPARAKGISSPGCGQTRWTGVPKNGKLCSSIWDEPGALQGVGLALRERQGASHAHGSGSRRPEPVCKMLGRWTPTVDQTSV